MPAKAEELVEVRQAGHWDTAEGAVMAQRYVGVPRGNLTHGEMSDFALANRAYMAGRNDLDLEVWQNAAKERIRWLSTQLATIQSLSTKTEELVACLERIVQLGSDGEHSGDRHALCRDYARNALYAYRGEQSS